MPFPPASSFTSGREATVTFLRAALLHHAFTLDKWLVRKIVKVAIDAAIAAAAIAAAALLAGQTVAFAQLALFVAVQTSIYYLLGGSNRIWYYTSFEDALVLGGGAVASGGLLLALSLGGALAIPPGVVLVGSLLFLQGALAVRLTRRLQVDRKRRSRNGRRNGKEAIRTLIVGAGDAANALIADIELNRASEWKIVGLLDDDPSKRGRMLRGLPILGSTAHLERFIQEERVALVILAIPSGPNGVQRSLIRRAEAHGVTVRAAPPLTERLGNGHARGRPVTLADLVDSHEVRRSLLARSPRAAREELILVTGGAGYIGSHLVRKLLARGFRVRVLDNLMYGAAGLEGIQREPGLEIIKGDISSVRDVVAAVKDADRVIALAAIVGDPACGLSAEETLNLNYESTKLLVEACNFYGVRRLVFASSCSVYGASDDQELTEGSALNPVSLYARTRILSEDVVLDRACDAAPVVLRLSTVFGLSPRMRFDLVVNTLTARAVVDGRIRITGGSQWRPFVHCQDAADAFILAATAEESLVRGEIFNVGAAAMNYTIEQVGALVAEEVGNGVRIESVSVADDLRNYRVSSAKITQTLGFRTAFDLRAGIREMVTALQETPALRDYDRSTYSNLKVLQDRLSGLPARTGGQPFVPRRTGQDRRQAQRRRRVTVLLPEAREHRSGLDRRLAPDRRLVTPGPPAEPDDDSLVGELTGTADRR